MRVVGRRTRERIKVRGEEVRVGTVWTPGREAGGDALGFNLLHRRSKGARVFAVDEHAGVARLELVLNGLAAPAARRHGC